MISLDQLTFVPSGSAAAPVVSGVAAPILGTLGSGWASDYKSKGYVVMISKADMSESKSLSMIMAKNPSDVAATAKAGGAFVIVDGPPAVIASAAALAQGGGTGPVDPTCGHGMVFSAAAKACVPIPGDIPPGGGKTAPSTTQESTLSKYALPLGIVAVGLVAAYLIMNKKKPSYRANARKYRMKAVSPSVRKAIFIRSQRRKGRSAKQALATWKLTRASGK
jgi:hypothetical protein